MTENEKKTKPNDSTEGILSTSHSDSKDECAEDSAGEKEAQEVAELVRDMPKPVRRKFEMSMMQMFSGRSGPMSHPFFEKFTEGHIDKFLDYSQQDDQNQYKFHSSNRWFKLAYMGISVAGIIFILIFFSNDQQTLNEILKLLAIFGGGVGSGYGLRSLKDRK